MAGSVLDVSSLVSQLITAERAPLDAQITRRESKATVQVSALATLKNALSTFKSNVEPLKAQSGFSPKTAKSSDTGILTVAADSTAATGTYNIEVVALAQAHQLASDAFSAGDAAVVGTGTLTITQDSTSFSVNIDSSHNTVEGIAEAINSATGNTSVQATIVRESGGSRLVLTSSKTGADNAIAVTQTGDAGLEQLTNVNLTEMQEALDAHIRVATFDHYSASNEIEDAIDGVTLNITAETELNTPVTVTVSRDTSTLISRVNAFVSAYNALATQAASLSSYTASTQAAGPLLGDAMLRGIQEQLRLDLSSVVSEGGDTYQTLASIGITKTADGKLSLDATQFTKALTADSNAVAAIFGSDNGVAAKLYGHLDSLLDTGSAIDARDQSLQSQLKQIAADKTKVDERIDAVQERYMKQFTALDVLLSGMQSTSDYLTQQLANLPKAYTG